MKKKPVMDEAEVSILVDHLKRALSAMESGTVTQAELLLSMAHQRQALRMVHAKWQA